MEIIFCGTGGARFVIMKQLRATGGFIIRSKANIYVDPGPGALIRSIELKQNLQNLDAIFISHAHIDHSNDSNLIVEAMTDGGKKKKGILIGSSSALEGNDRFDRVVSAYHQNMVEKKFIARAGDRFSVKGVGIEATPTKHEDTSAVGFKLSDGGRTIGYTSDTEYVPELGRVFSGCDLLILNNLRPAGSPYPGHLDSGMSIRVLKEAKPKKAIIQHFGMGMLRAGPEAEAKFIEKESGVETTAAKDGMIVRIEEGKSLADFE